MVNVKMERFNNILFVEDSSVDSEPAFRRAVRLARNNKATLTVVSVLRELDRNLPNLQLAIIKGQKKRLLEFTRSVSTKGITVHVKSLTGIPFLEIVKEVISGHYDLLIKTAEGRGGRGRLLFGSTDWQLMRACPCPVWIMKRQEQERYSRILAAVDPDPAVKANEELNRVILDLAKSLSVQDKAELNIVHAWSVPLEEQIRSGELQMAPADVERVVKETRAAHEQWLSELLENYDLSNVSTKIHLLKGAPSKVIPSVAKKSRAQLVVMGTVARTGIPGFLIGNTAERTLSALDCSVLTVKPKAFATPVQV
jgi:universal stress protein E